MRTTVPFRDRAEAGRRLAARLAAYAGRDDVVVLALPRGGVPVGHEVARAIGAPLDVLVVRKLGVPGYEELALGAIASGGVRVVDPKMIHDLRISRAALGEIVERERHELARRETAYRGDRPPTAVAGRVVILVDDGLATGSTMLAAVAAARGLGAARVVVAVPVGSHEACTRLGREADEVVCELTPSPFHAVGLWYEDFSETTDDEVRRLLDRSPREPEPASPRA